ncbi:hypothetical protein H6G00_22440 [Leptolyngbya sp. FACHB-541]|uniref:hypothetical protein n=1 Tax=Leptolyngbya sp. FACHB-541 TaxID=2692810 RepID=UPI0016860412|nr:hypothetical protein [Leptolyngbya sp. FACHB-541]MBD1999336.1 hypothetical protein [Leptolyngbya sp. FACHB-541]
MFESNFRQSNALLGLDRCTGLNDKFLSGFQNSTDAYGLQAGASLNKFQGSGSSLTGSSLSVGGTLLIQGGTTSAAEINEVNSRLSQSFYWSR